MNRLTLLIVFLSASLYAAAPPLHKCDAGGFTSTVGGCTLTATTAGNLVVVTATVQSTTATVTSITDGGGGNTWHVLGPAVGTNTSSYIAWTVVTNSFASWQFNWGETDNGDASGAEYSGMASAGTVADCNSATGSGSGTALASGSCTPTAANDVLVGVGVTHVNSVTYTAGGSFMIEGSQAHSTTGSSYAWEDENSVSCASQNATMTGSTTGPWSMMFAAFKTSAPTACTSGGGNAKMMNLERYE